jgi:hypothetical protein
VITMMFAHNKFSASGQANQAVTLLPEKRRTAD